MVFGDGGGVGSEGLMILGDCGGVRDRYGTALGLSDAGGWTADFGDAGTDVEVGAGGVLEIFLVLVMVVVVLAVEIFDAE
ncbi:hypothetical protein DsansV1_C30g0214261 [Dioscorea sansibarensis]